MLLQGGRRGGGGGDRVRAVLIAQAPQHLQTSPPRGGVFPDVVGVPHRGEDAGVEREVAHVGAEGGA
jgi:hypothetical protein